MANETEHRYLVRSEEWKQKSPQAEHYQQGYLSLDPERSVRVRSTDKAAVITVKSSRNGLSRSEFEYPIPLSDAKQILQQLCVKPIITKTRYKLRQDGQAWDIDEYEAENKGLLVAEAEVNSAAKRVKKPAWVGEEISGQERFDNINLIQHPFQMWPENGGQSETKFHLKPSESIPQGISRTLHEQLQTAVHVLSNAGDPGKAIHEARKSLKKTRSILRLGRSALKPVYSAANGNLRDLGRKLSAVRDAVALVELVNQIREDQDDKQIQASTERALDKLRRKQEAAVQDFLGSGEKGRIVEALNKVMSESASWPVEKIDFQGILVGVKSTFQRGQQALALAHSRPRSENFHEWRKRAKDLRYQLSFLHKLWPEVLQGYADSAEDLEQKLGDDHNLSVLSDLLRDLALPKRESAAIASIIRKRQSKLRKEAFQTGGMLYAESAKRWARRLDYLWHVRR